MSFTDLKNHLSFRLFCYLLILTLFTATFWNLKIPNGTIVTGKYDFLAFYTGGKLFEEDRKNLYSLKSQIKMQNKIAINAKKYLPLAFLNPPFVAYFFSFFNDFSIEKVFNAWLVINIIIVGIICVLVIKLNGYGWYTKIGIAMSVFMSSSVYYSLRIGQLSNLLLLSTLLSWILYKRRSIFLSGLSLSFLWIKPQFVILPILIIVLHRNPRLLAGFAAGSILFFLVSLQTVGTEGIKSYLDLLATASGWTMEYGNNIADQFTIQSLIVTFTGNFSIVIKLIGLFLSVLVFLVTFYISKSKLSVDSYKLNIAWASIIFATVLISPHIHFQDLTFLFAPCIILFEKTKKDLDLKKYVIIPAIMIFSLFIFYDYIISFGTLLSFINEESVAKSYLNRGITTFTVLLLMAFYLKLVATLVKKTRKLKM